MTVKRWGVLVVVLSGFIAACGSGGPGAAGIAPTRPGPFASAGDQIVADLVAGNFAAVTAKFDPTMTAAMPPASLENSWKTYQQLLGAYRSHGSPASVMKGQLDVERVPVTMAGGGGEVRITFHPDGTIAGLYFLKAGAPAP